MDTTYRIIVRHENGLEQYVKIKRNEDLMQTYIKHVDNVNEATLFNDEYIVNKLIIRLNNEFPIFKYFEVMVPGQP